LIHHTLCKAMHAFTVISMIALNCREYMW